MHYPGGKEVPATQMGKNRKSRNVTNVTLDGDTDDDNLSSTSSGWSETTIAHETEQVDSLEHDLEKHLEALYEKRAQTREKALVELVKAFESQVLGGFVENKCVTLLNMFINSVKRGSAREVALAARAIGLLALTVGTGGNAHEIMEEAIPQLHQALKSGSDSLKRSSVLDCLAIITFIGGEAGDDAETEKSMKIIWELINPKSGSNVILSKTPPAVLSSAISAWSLLLTTVTQRKVNSTNWQESISLLSNLLEKEDRSVRFVAGEALALIFELNSVDKFSRNNTVSNGLDFEGNNKAHAGMHAGMSYIEALKGKILTQARDLSVEAGGKGSDKTDLGTQRILFQRVVDFIETKEFDDVSVKVLNNCSPLTISSWAQSIQLNFLKRFLASGYLKHMQDNELLHEIFNYKPKKRDNLSVKEKRMYLSPNSAVNKERTQYLNKRRSWAQDRNHGHFAVGVVEEE